RPTRPSSGSGKAGWSRWSEPTPAGWFPWYSHPSEKGLRALAPQELAAPRRFGRLPVRCVSFLDAEVFVDGVHEHAAAQERGIVGDEAVEHDPDREVVRGVGEAE